MIDKEYKGFYISHDYQQQSENFDKIDRYLIWTANYEDLVAEEFKTKSEAEFWSESTSRNYKVRQIQLAKRKSSKTIDEV